MRLSIKAKQVASVMLIVGLSVTLVSAWYLTELGHVRIEETYAGAELVSKAVRQRVFDVVQEGGTSLEAIKNDKGIKSILTSGDAYAANVLYTVIVNREDIVVQGDEARLGQPLARAADLNGLMNATRWEQVKVLSTSGGRSYEIRAPLVIGTDEIGAVRVGVSTLLLRSQLEQALLVPAWTAFGALAVGLLV
jgi:sensor histidine kinase regulating citrate/malate metabolism